MQMRLTIKGEKDAFGAELLAAYKAAGNAGWRSSNETMV
jgi:hypothetical protein